MKKNIALLAAKETAIEWLKAFAAIGSVVFILLAIWPYLTFEVVMALYLASMTTWIFISLTRSTFMMAYSQIEKRLSKTGRVSAVAQEMDNE